MKISLLDERTGKAYDDFLLQFPHVLLYASNKYRLLLRSLLGADDRYLVSQDVDGAITGVLPTFIKRNPKLGNVLNSLPFYGSHGGVVCRRDDVREALLGAYCGIMEKEQCVSATLITSPFDTPGCYKWRTEPTFVDQRIGQLTPLGGCTRDPEQSLMNLIHQKTRNMVRKARKESIRVERTMSGENLEFLIRSHKENMAEIGGIPKEESFFRLVVDIFEYEEDYEIFTAFAGSVRVASLLVFYFNRTAEYYTPTVVKEYRTFQPLSLLIYEAMVRAIERGFEWWNWGGTWLTQDGVYHFKKKWGTQDKPYFYFVKVADKGILANSKEKLLAEYPNFYVTPFRELQPV